MPHLLVVEDDPVSSRILVNLLQKRGHVAHVASGVGDAISVLERNTLVDLVILDNQLHGEYGWQFLEYIRKDFIFRNLPVLVYTGSSDRNSVLKYLQLGVQKILVKPYNAGQIEEELTRAVQFDWRGMVFEPAARVCQRLNISEDEYYKSLIRGAIDIKEHIPSLNKLVGSRDLRQFDEHLSALQSMALTLGISLLENAVESIQQTVRDSKLEQCIYLINRLVPTARLMHHRALSYFGMTGGAGAEEFPKDLFEDSGLHDDQMARKSRDVLRESSSSPHGKVDPLDVMIQSPLGAFVDDFKLIIERNIFAKGDVDRVVFGANAAVGIEDILDIMRFLREINNAPLDATAARLRLMPGMEMRIIDIANNVSTRGERIQTLEQAVHVMGGSMTSCIVVPLSLLRASRRGRNPLRLEAMARHNMAVSLLVRELAIKFSGTQDFTAAALSYGVGRWLLAVEYPAFYGMVLLLGRASPAERLQIERNMFATDHRELSAHLASILNFPQSVIATALFIEKPDKSPDLESKVVASMVNLADLLARISEMGYTGGDSEVGDDDFINSPAWGALRKAQINIPLDPPEYLSALTSVVDRVRHLVDMAFE
jgi:two-component system, chemotaxis family, chemotaxis protein CheY